MTVSDYILLWQVVQSTRVPAVQTQVAHTQAVQAQVVPVLAAQRIVMA